MAGDLYGSDAKPAYLDPFHTIVEVGGFGSGLLTFPLAIHRGPTISFQQGKFDRQSCDWAEEHVSPDTPQDTNPLSHFLHATQFRYIWASQRIELSGWTGTTWTTAKDADAPPIADFRTGGGGEWGEQLAGSNAPKITGLPSLPVTRSLNNVLGSRGVPGESGERFSPQAEWVPVEGPALDERPPGGITTKAFRKVTKATIQLRGIKVTPTSLRFLSTDLRSYRTEVAIGIDVLGGPIASSGDYPSTFEPLEISLAGITVTHKSRIYKAVGCVDVPGRRPSGTALAPREPGALYVLCARTTDRKWFPRG